jgi:hypothetical protein
MWHKTAKSSTMISGPQLPWKKLSDMHFHHHDVWWQNKQRLNTKKRKPESAYIVNWVTNKVKEITTAFSFGIREEENTQYVLGV